MWIQRGGRFGVATALMISLATVVPDANAAASAQAKPTAAIPAADTVRIAGLKGADELPDAEPLPDQVDALPEGAAEVDPSAAWRAVPGTPVAVRDTTKVAVPGEEPGDPAVVEQVPADEQAGSAPAVEVAIEPAIETTTPSLVVKIGSDQAAETPGPSVEPTPSSDPSPSAEPTLSGGRAHLEEPDPTQEPDQRRLFGGK